MMNFLGNLRVRLWLILTCAVFAVICPRAASGQTPPAGTITSFTVSANPTGPVTQKATVTFTATVTGNEGVPDGEVTFFLSASATCATEDDEIGSQESATGTFTTTGTNLAAGTFYVCGLFESFSTTYPNATSTPTQTLQIYGTKVNVTGPGTALTNQAVTFVATVTASNGGPAPTGTVTLQNETTGTTYGPTNLANGSATFNLPGEPAGDYDYYVTYSGDGNYVANYFYNDYLVLGGLTTSNPSAAVTGSPDTPVTLTGEGFTAGSVAQAVPAAGGGAAVNLNTTFVNATTLQVVIPAGELAAAGTLNLSVVTGTATSNTFGFRVYTKYTDQLTGSATPTTFTYGTAAQVAITTGVTRGTGGANDAVPSGEVSFSLSGSTTPLVLVPLGQVATAGAYVLGPQNPIDAKPSNIRSADINGDGFTDVVSYSGNSGSYVQMFLSTGTDVFQSEVQVYSGCPPVDFALADINQDGKPDLIVACSTYENSAPVVYYSLGNGDGSFQTPVGVTVPANSTFGNANFVAVGDFNGDGALDIAVVNYNNVVQIFSGSLPFGTFTPLAPVTYPNAQYIGPISFGAADFNQDGKSDLAVLSYGYVGNGASPYAGTLTVLTSNGDGTFTPQQQSYTSVGEGGAPFTITDVNGDNYPDIAIPGQGASGSATEFGQIQIFENNGSGVLSPTYTYPAPDVISVIGTPFPAVGAPATPAQPAWNLFYTSTNDGALSTYALQRQTATSYTVVYSNTNTGDVATYVDSDYQPVPITVGDFNGDGFLDVALSASPSTNGYTSYVTPLYFANDATGTATANFPFVDAGTYTLNGSYPGDMNYAGGNVPAITVTVGKATPAFQVSGPTTGTVGQSLTFTATLIGIEGGTVPSGGVQFYYDAGGALGGLQTITVANNVGTAQVTTNSLLAGQHTIYASYSGDANYVDGGSGNSITVVVGNGQPPAASSTTLTVTPGTGTATAGQVLTLQAQTTLGGGGVVDTGSVTFYDGKTLLGTAQVAGANAANGFVTGQAVLKTRLGPGAHSLTAAFQGTSTVAAAVSAVTTLTVTGTEPSSVALTAAANATTATNYDFTAIVSGDGYSSPTGTLNFTDLTTGAALGSQTLMGTGQYTAVAAPASSVGITNVIYNTVADLNNDGIPDLVVEYGVNNDSQFSIGVSLGNGDGTFQPAASYAIGTNNGGGLTYNSFSIGDFNQDGIPDIIASNSSATMVYVLIGRGDGTFANAVAYASGHGAQTVTIGDVNGDGVLDAVSPDQPTGGLDVLLGNGDGTFTPSTTATGPADADPLRIITGKFTTSGNLDVVASSTSLDELLFYAGHGDGTFAAATTLTVGSGPIGLIAGDWNGDGKLDLAVANVNTVSVLIGNGDGTFQTAVTYSAGNADQSILTADVNGDGIPDLILSGASGGAVVLLGQGDGTFVAQAQTVPATSDLTLAAADTNGDGVVDLISSGYQPVSVSLGGTSLTATLPDVMVAGMGSHTVQAAYVPATNSIYTASMGTVAVTANGMMLTPVVTWPTPAPIVSGTALSATQLDATASVPGTFVYTPPAGTVLTTGSYTLSVTFTPTDTADYSAVTQTVTLVVTAPPPPAATPSVTTLTATPAALTTGQVVTLISTTTPANGTTPIATGSTTFYDGKVILGTAQITGLYPASGFQTGQAVLKTRLGPGTHSITAQFSGTSTATASTSAVTTITVTGTEPSSIALSAAANATTAANYDFTAVVSGFGHAPPAGMVNFTDQTSGVVLGSAPVTMAAGDFNLVPAPAIGFTNAVSTATVDFNNDGILDLAVEYYSPDFSQLSVTVSLGVGDGTFMLGTSYLLGGSDGNYLYNAIGVGDFNQDGIPDIIATDVTTNSLYVLIGKGDGTFANPVTYTGAMGGAQSIVVGDVNGDGIPDAVAPDNIGDINVMLGRGDGTFLAPTTVASPGGGGDGILLGVFTGSGAMDVVITDTSLNELNFFAGHGDGTFSPATMITVGNNPSAITKGDWNGDGKLDLAVTNQSDNTVSVLLGNGDGTFQPQVVYPVGSDPISIITSDVNDDGIPDLLVSNFEDGTISVLLGNGDGTFAAQTTLPATGGILSAGDLNGDGVVDLVTAGPTVTAVLGGTSLTTTLPDVAIVGTGMHTVQAAFVPAANSIYDPSTATVTVAASGAPIGLSLTSISPTSAVLGSADTTITLTGAGFVAGSVAELGGTPLATTYVSATQLTAVIPASFLATLQSGVVTVVNPNAVVSEGETFTVLPPSVDVVLSGPPTSPPATQPTITFQLPTAYPVAINGTFTITVTPATAGGLVDPAVQFLTGGDTFTFTLPANSTTTPTVQLQTGTLAATITVTLTLTAGTVNITPDTLQPVVIQVPPSAPTITSMVLTRSGTNLTVTIQGFSNTRDMKSAMFTFTGAAGATINTPSLTANVDPSFVTWYGEPTSDQFGSAFTYIQTFVLSDDASTVGSVSATLVNSIGNSNTKSAQ